MCYMVYLTVSPQMEKCNLLAFMFTLKFGEIISLHKNLSSIWTLRTLWAKLPIYILVLKFVSLYYNGKTLGPGTRQTY